MIGSSPSLTALSLANCQLSSAAGKQLAEGLRRSTASELPLKHLELQRNNLDSRAGLELAEALTGNHRLTELNVSNNPMDGEALTALKEARKAVEDAWRHTAEGKAYLKANKQAAHKNSNTAGVIGDLLHSLTS